MRRRAGLLLVLGSCTAEDIDPMEEQQKYKPYAPNPFFADGRAMRPPPEGSVPREREPLEPPQAITPALMETGRAKFDAMCAACHGLLGDGESIVATKMALRPPPSLLDPEMRAMSGEQLFGVISDGYGLMPRLGSALDPRERWGVVAYVRALQLSQQVPVSELPDDLRQQLEKRQRKEAP